MVTVSIIAIVIFVLASIFRGTLVYTKQEHPGDYKAIIFFSAGACILNGMFWLILFTMGTVTIIKLIWGG